MPLPAPRSGEDKDAFVARFMGDDKMITEFPDARQRRAVAESQWRETHKRDIAFAHAIAKVDEEQRLVFGWASVIEEGGKPVVDSQGDAIAEADLTKAAHRFIADARVARLMHEGGQIGEIVESVVLTRDVQKALGIDLGRVGWFIGVKIHDDQVWKAVKDGTFGAFSIGGTGIREVVDGDAAA